MAHAGRMRALPCDVLHRIAQRLDRTSLLAAMEAGVPMPLTPEDFKRRAWGATCPDEALRFCRWYPTYRHPIADAQTTSWGSTGWGTPHYCKGVYDAALETIAQGAEPMWELLAWARANCCPWPIAVRDAVTHLTVPEGVTSLGNDAFADCASLISIRLADSLTSLDNGTFWGCAALMSVHVPDGVESMGSNTFAWCTSLISVRMPKSLISLGWRTFSECIRLISVQMPDGLTSMGDGTFWRCLMLTSVWLPDGLASTNFYCTFYQCLSLRSVRMPACPWVRSAIKMALVDVPDTATL